MLKNLRELRDEAGISQQTLATAVGVSQQSINKYENHSVEPDIGTLIRLADYFETSVDYIIGHTNIRRKIEQVRSFDLNDEEGTLINSYRALTAKQKSAIKAVIDSYGD